MQQKNLNQVNHILKRIRCFCLSIFVVCLTLSVCVPVNAATATEQSVVDDTTQQETKKADTQMKEQRTIRVGSLAQGQVGDCSEKSRGCQSCKDLFS